MPESAEDANCKLVARLTGIIASGDLDLLAEHPGYYETRIRFPALRAAFPDLTVEIEKQLASGELVCTHAWLSGTHRGEWLGITPTGRSVRFQNIAVDRVVDGKVVQHNAESGWLSLLMALDVLPLQ